MSNGSAVTLGVYQLQLWLAVTDIHLLGGHAHFCYDVCIKAVGLLKVFLLAYSSLKERM